MDESEQKVQAMINRIHGTPQRKKEDTSNKPKNYDHVLEEQQYQPDEYNFLEAQRLTLLLQEKMRIEQAMGQVQNVPSMGGKDDHATKGQAALETINKQINQVVQHFRESPHNEAYLGNYAKFMPIISQVYGNKNPDLYTGSHLGTDFATPRGEVVSVPEGKWKVVEAFNQAGEGGLHDFTNRGYGNSVLLQNQYTGEKIRVSHLDDVRLQQGQDVEGGAVIGASGNTGHSSAEHTDVEYYDKNNKLGNVLQTQYPTSLFLKPAPVKQTPDKQMVDLQNKTSAFRNAFTRVNQVQASQSTMKPIAQTVRPTVQQQTVAPKVQPQTNPWVNQVKTYAPQQTVQKQPVQQVIKPVQPIMQQPQQKQNLLQRAVGAFYNLFNRR